MKKKIKRTRLSVKEIDIVCDILVKQDKNSIKCFLSAAIKAFL